LGIWRVGDPIHRSRTAELALAQPADSVGSPRWDYVIKRALCGDAEECQQAARFASAACDAVHPNLIAVLDASTSSPAPYVVMPRLDGLTMQQHLDDAEAKPLPVALWLVRQVAQALGTLHDAGWVHGDVKPANVMIGARGHVTLVDLSFASRVQTVTPGKFRGTPQYSAPESLVENVAAMPPRDVFSLGRMLWQWITRTQPVAQAVLEPVAELVESMIEENPAARPTADVVARQLLRLEIETLGQHIGPSDLRKAA
jgi:serine/threonine protein kinase